MLLNVKYIIVTLLIDNIISVTSEQYIGRDSTLKRNVRTKFIMDKIMNNT